MGVMFTNLANYGAPPCRTSLKIRNFRQVPVWFLSLLQDEETAVVGALLQWLTWDEDNGIDIGIKFKG
jgi:hypothetical protein